MQPSRKQKNSTQNERKYVIIFQFKDEDPYEYEEPDNPNRYYMKTGARKALTYEEAKKKATELTHENKVNGDPPMEFSIAELVQTIKIKRCPRCLREFQ